MADTSKSTWPDWINQRQPSRSHSQPLHESGDRYLSDDRPQSLLPHLTFNHPPPAKYTQTEPLSTEEKEIGTTPLPPLAVPKVDTKHQSVQTQVYHMDKDTMTVLPPVLVSRSTMVSPKSPQHKDQSLSPIAGLTISPVIMPVQYVYDTQPNTSRISPLDVKLGPVFITDTRKQTSMNWQFLPHNHNGMQIQ